MLTEAQKIEIRRFCGFPVYGNGLNSLSPPFNYNYNRWYMTLEYRMNNLAVEEEITIENIYLKNLRALESDIPNASKLLQVDKAAVFIHNKNEVRDRYNLFQLWCERLSNFMGLPEGGFQNLESSYGGFSFIV